MNRVICDHTIAKRNFSDAFQTSLREEMRTNDRIVYLDCDLMGCINATKIREEFPERTFNCGIQEANAMAAAAGLAATGLIPFFHSFGVFASRRAFDQAFLSAGYSKWPVHVIGSDAGVTAANNGATHMPLEDCGLYLNIPNAVVIDPADYAQCYCLTKKLVDVPAISYMRLVRKAYKTIYEDGTDFTIGKGVLLREGNDVTIITSGIMVNNALEAAEILETEGIHAEVLDLFTWQPLDEELILHSLGKTGALVTCENHRTATGLGSLVANLTVQKHPVPQEFIGIKDSYGEVGYQDYLETIYHMKAKDIAQAARRAINRK